MVFYRNCVQSEERNSSFHREMFNSKSKIPIVALDVSHPSLIQAKSTITLLLGGRLTLQAEVGQMQKDLGLGDNLVNGTLSHPCHHALFWGRSVSSISSACEREKKYFLLNFGRKNTAESYYFRNIPGFRELSQ